MIMLYEEIAREIMTEKKPLSSERLKSIQTMSAFEGWDKETFDENIEFLSDIRNYGKASALEIIRNAIFPN